MCVVDIMLNSILIVDQGVLRTIQYIAMAANQLLSTWAVMIAIQTSGNVWNAILRPDVICRPIPL